MCDIIAPAPEPTPKCISKYQSAHGVVGYTAALWPVDWTGLILYACIANTENTRGK
jgi:hypothetical protein